MKRQLIIQNKKIFDCLLFKCPLKNIQNKVSKSTTFFKAALYEKLKGAQCFFLLPKSKN